MKRVFVIVLAHDAEPWRTIQEDGQKRTWAADPDVPVRWLHGQSSGLVRFAARAIPTMLRGSAVTAFYNLVGKWVASRRVRTVGDRIETSTPETYLMTNAKTVAAFRHILDTEDFDYILRTNTSSYVNLPLLQRFVQSLPNTGYYGGTLWEKNGMTYVTGTSILLSREMVEHAAYDKEWDFDLIDDLALGRSMERAGVSPRPIPRVDACTAEALQSLTFAAVSSTFIIRCRGAGDRGHDIAAMSRVHELLGRGPAYVDPCAHDRAQPD